MNQQQVACPNCGLPQDAAAPACDNCGMPLVPNAMRYDKRKLMLGNWVADTIFGFILSIGLMFIGIGVIVAPVLYFATRDSKPFFARGAGYATLLLLLVIFGLFLWCLGWLRF
jgi:hypothetical protein